MFYYIDGEFEYYGISPLITLQPTSNSWGFYLRLNSVIAPIKENQKIVLLNPDTPS